MCRPPKHSGVDKRSPCAARRSPSANGALSQRAEFSTREARQYMPCCAVAPSRRAQHKRHSGRVRPAARHRVAIAITTLPIRGAPASALARCMWRASSLPGTPRASPNEPARPATARARGSATRRGLRCGSFGRPPAQACLRPRSPGTTPSTAAWLPSTAPPPRARSLSTWPVDREFAPLWQHAGQGPRGAPGRSTGQPHHFSGCSPTPPPAPTPARGSQNNRKSATTSAESSARKPARCPLHAGLSRGSGQPPQEARRKADCLGYTDRDRREQLHPFAAREVRLGHRVELRPPKKKPTRNQSSLSARIRKECATSGKAAMKTKHASTGSRCSSPLDA